MNILILAAISCYELSNDQRAYCQAREHSNPGYCYSITDKTLRETCRSEVEQKPWNCDSISSYEDRRLCRNKAENK